MGSTVSTFPELSNDIWHAYVPLLICPNTPACSGSHTHLQVLIVTWRDAALLEVWSLRDARDAQHYHRSKGNSMMTLVSSNLAPLTYDVSSNLYPRKGVYSWQPVMAVHNFWLKNIKPQTKLLLHWYRLIQNINHLRSFSQQFPIT